jgi:hypothetical protein
MFSKVHLRQCNTHALFVLSFFFFSALESFFVD